MRPVERNNKQQKYVEKNIEITVNAGTIISNYLTNAKCCSGSNGFWWIDPQGKYLDVKDVVTGLVKQNDGQSTAANDQNNWSGLLANDNQFILALIPRLGSGSTNEFGYGDARLSLINGLGAYCSYCGMPVNDSSLAVEHVLPKSWFTDEMLSYLNFLLACNPCNSGHKGSRPTFNQGKAWAMQQIPAPDYVQIKQGAIDMIVWPTDNPAYNSFILVLNNAGTPIVNGQYNLNNNWISTKDNKVSANINGAQYNNVNTTFNSTGPWSVEASKLIALVGLNATDPDDLRATDRRNVNRTVAFFEAIAAYNRLNQGFGLPANMFNLLFYQALSTTRLSGFYEVWIVVFNYWSQPGKGVNSLYAQFKQNTCDPNNNNAYFPGTVEANLP